MAYIPSANVCELVMFGQLAGQQVNTVHHFLYPAPITPPDLVDMAVTAQSAWLDDVAAEVSSQFQILSTKATDLTTASSGTYQQFPALAMVGAVAQNSVPNNVAVVITQYTAGRGRSFRGRTYHAGTPVGFLTNPSQLVDANRTGLAIAYFNFWADIEDGTGSTHVVLSKFANGVARAAGLASPVVSVNVNLDLDSQRRRLAGRGA